MTKREKDYFDRVTEGDFGTRLKRNHKPSLTTVITPVPTPESYIEMLSPDAQRRYRELQARRGQK